jgi:hypothetical protein
MTKQWDDPYWPRDGWTGAGYKSEEKSMVDIKVDKTFSFSQDNVLDLIVDYLKREHQVEVSKDKLVVKITDSTTAGYMDDQHVPAKLDSISVKVPADGQK